MPRCKYSHVHFFFSSLFFALSCFGSSDDSGAGSQIQVCLSLAVIRGVIQ